MDEVVRRLSLQLALRPAPWVAVVHGDDRPTDQLIAALGRSEIHVIRADRVPAEALVGPGRWVVLVPESATDLPKPPRLAAHIGGPGDVSRARERRELPPPLGAVPVGSDVDPEPLLESGLSGAGRSALAALSAGCRALVERGWFADAGYFVEAYRFEAYRLAATTWEDRELIGHVALVEELTGRVALACDDVALAWESWRTAWWMRGSLATDDAGRLELARTGHHLGAVSLLLDDPEHREEGLSRLEHARDLYARLGRPDDAGAVGVTRAWRVRG